MTTPITVTAFQCPECSTIYSEDSLVTIYECSRCSQTSTERRCQDDNIFMARAGEGCEACETPCDEIEAVEDHDGELIPADEYDPNESKADRDAVAAAIAQRAQDEKAQQEREALDAASEATTVAALSVGDWIMHPAPSHPSHHDEQVEVVALPQWGGGTVGLIFSYYGSMTVIPTLPDREVTRVPAPDFRKPLGPFGVVRFEADPDEAPTLSSPSHDERYTVETSHLSEGSAPEGDVASLTITTQRGNYLTVLGVFVDRTHAEETLSVWESAARALADRRSVPLVSDGSAVSVESARWARYTDSMGRPSSLSLGTLDWGEATTTPYIHANLPGMSITIGDPHRLLAVVEVARGQLGHLDH